MSLLGILAIASVIPPKRDQLVAGSMQAFSQFCRCLRFKSG
jgi:hypothetical protein